MGKKNYIYEIIYIVILTQTAGPFLLLSIRKWMPDLSGTKRKQTKIYNKNYNMFITLITFQSG